MVAVSSSYAQTYKPDWATKLVLAGGGTDVTNTVAITTQAGGSSPLTYTFPNAVTDGYILQTNGSGTLTWVDPTTALASITLGGDLSGTAGNATVAKINGVALGSTTATSGNLLIANGASWVSQPMSGDAAIDATGATIVSKFNNGTSFGSMAGQSAGSVAITGGTIDGAVIGGTSAAAATFTNLTATGTVTLPAGSVSASSLGLADGKILIGDGTNHAAAQTLGGDIALSNNTGNVNVNSVQTGAGSSIATAINSSGANAINGDNITHNATLEHATSNQLGINLANANTWTGTQTMGGMKVSSNAVAQLTANQNDWALSASNSYFFISADAARNVTGIAPGATPDGRMIVLVNVGAFAITLKNANAGSLAANRFNFVGGVDGDLIIAPNGTVTLIYDNVNTTKGWRLISAQ